MTLYDDDVDMWEQAWADRLLKGESVDGDAGITELVAAVRATAERPAPRPSAELATLLREGLPTEECAGRRVPEQVRAWGSRTVRAAVAGVAASLAMGAGVATAAAGGGGTALDYVPEPVKRGVDAAVTVVADVLRSDPEPTAPAPSAPDDDGSGTERTSDESRPAKTKTTRQPVDGSTPAAPAETALQTPAPSAAPTAPVATTPAPQPSEPAPSLPPSALPTPGSEPSEQPAEEPSESGSPDGEGRKPLDNQNGSPSPSPSPSPSSSPSPSPSSSAEPEPAPGEGTDPGEGDEQSVPLPGSGEQSSKPGRAELTVERIG